MAKANQKENNLFLAILILATTGLGIAEAVVGRRIDEVQNNRNRRVHKNNIDIAFKSFLAYTLLYIVLLIADQRRRYFNEDLYIFDAR